MELPDLTGRMEILNHYLGKVKSEENIDVNEVARLAAGCSGAELRNIVNEAALLALRQGREKVSQADLEESIDITSVGYLKKPDHRASRRSGSPATMRSATPWPAPSRPTPPRYRRSPCSPHLRGAGLRPAAGDHRAGDVQPHPAGKPHRHRMRRPGRRGVLTSTRSTPAPPTTSRRPPGWPAPSWPATA